ncbi:ribosome maturation factor RimP [soil metagenome]
MNRAPTHRLEDVLLPAVAAVGADLDAVEIAAAGRRQVLRLVVDRAGDLTLDDIAEVSRAASKQLDASGAMGERPYTLEVTSRGVDRPLTLPRHWVRNTGRLVSVTIVEHAPEPRAFTGRIAGADDDGADVVVDGRRRRVPYADVKRAVVQVDFTAKEA